MSYLDDGDAWERFWSAHRAALLGQGDPLTYEGHGLGLAVHGGAVGGRPNLYPYFQRPTRGAWLAQVLAAPVSTRTGRQTVAETLRALGLELRCEPGRSLVDGCGLTAARVEFRKQRRDGTWLIGLAMNRTQCRSTSDDFLVDPLLLRPLADAPATEAIEGYLVGAYCIERELLTWRRLRFPRGVAVGDIVVFPNTAGYLMHILESASHQIPLARNLVLAAGAEPSLDPIDEPCPH
jgi:diaminopimelate decarboxylase